MKALIVDDDLVLADVLAFTLRREGFEVFLAHDGVIALERWGRELPDIVILDVNLPRLDGFSVCREIRAMSSTPIILLTVREDEEDIITGLQAGADDYVVKPFSPRQLVARVQAVLRRALKMSAAPAITSGDVHLDVEQHQLTLGENDPIQLTLLETRLMEYLMINAGTVMPMDGIIDYVWGSGEGGRDMLRQLVRRLRAKLGPEPDRSALITTIPGQGYGFRVDS